MNLNKMILSDGHIDRYEILSGNLQIFFTDYCNSSYRMNFQSVSDIQDFDCIGYDLSDVKISKDIHGYFIRFFADSDLIFSMHFKSVEVVEIV